MRAPPGRDFAVAGKWLDLFDELAMWQAAGRRAPIWWRDDDACEPSRALSRLLEISARNGAPLLLAVIPECAAPDLAGAVQASGAPVAVAQHGIGHHNNAPEGEKKTELHDSMLDQPGFRAALAAHRCRLEDQFGAVLVPIMVPPWNRIGPGTKAALAGLGYRGLSAEGRTGTPPQAPFRIANVHIDLVDWSRELRSGELRSGGPRSGEPCFIGTDRALALIIEGLRARRLAGDAEPLGIMTHHLVHDRALWTFLAQFVALIAGHRAVHWLSAHDIFGP